MNPTQHSTHTRRPRNAAELLTRAVCGLQTLSLAKAQGRERLNIETAAAPLLRKHAPADDVEFLDQHVIGPQGRIGRVAIGAAGLVFVPTASTMEGAK